MKPLFMGFNFVRNYFFLVIFIKSIIYNSILKFVCIGISFR